MVSSHDVAADTRMATANSTISEATTIKVVVVIVGEGKVRVVVVAEAAHQRRLSKTGHPAIRYLVTIRSVFLSALGL